MVRIELRRDDDRGLPKFMYQTTALSFKAWLAKQENRGMFHRVVCVFNAPGFRGRKQLFNILDKEERYHGYTVEVTALDNKELVPATPASAHDWDIIKGRYKKPEVVKVKDEGQTVAAIMADEPDDEPEPEIKRVRFSSKTPPLKRDLVKKV